MGFLAECKMYGRFGFGLRKFLRRTISLDEARAIVMRRMDERESNFLRLVEQGIFDYPRSPYLPLMRLAGCEVGDIRDSVRTKGLESTLLDLRKAGVYFTFEEFKGRAPVVRNGKTVRVNPRDFDNPYPGQYYYQAKSGGSTGAGTRVQIDLDHQAAQAPHLMLARDAHGVLNTPTALWYGTLPDDTGVGVLLRQARFGRIAEKWFSTTTREGMGGFARGSLVTYFFVALGRLLGAGLPFPEPLPLKKAQVLARWAREKLNAHGKCLIRSHVSQALRVCLAAQKEGFDLEGATFMGGGEPPTPAKIREVTKTGARWVPTYFFTEHGAAGLGCARPVDANDLHILMDMLSVIQHPRSVGESGPTVDAFHFTSLLPTAPKIMLNVESDDYGVLDRTPCGCALEALGFADHVREVRSFRKLTGDGVTLVGSEMLHVLEEVLPARFGGTAMDYQLIEEEGDNGLTRMSLIVSPEVTLSSEKDVLDVVFESLKRESVAGKIARSVWTQSGALRIKRMDPVCTERGKMMSLHRVKPAASANPN